MSEPTPSTPPTPSPSQMRDMMPFAVGLGIEIEAADPAEVRATMPWAAERCTIGDALHGGALMAFADTIGAVVAFLNLPEGAVGTTTIESKTNFFRALRGGKAVATGRPLHAGRTTIVVVTDLHDDDGRHLARVTQTQAVLLR